MKISFFNHNKINFQWIFVLLLYKVQKYSKLLKRKNQNFTRNKELSKKKILLEKT